MIKLFLIFWFNLFIMSYCLGQTAYNKKFQKIDKKKIKGIDKIGLELCKKQLSQWDILSDISNKNQLLIYNKDTINGFLYLYDINKFFDQKGGEPLPDSLKGKYVIIDSISVKAIYHLKIFCYPFRKDGKMEMKRYRSKNDSYNYIIKWRRSYFYISQSYINCVDGSSATVEYCEISMDSKSKRKVRQDLKLLFCGLFDTQITNYDKILK